MAYQPKPPITPGYQFHTQGLSSDQRIQQLEGEVEQLTNYMNVAFALSAPSSNYQNPLDSFYNNAGITPTYLFNFAGPFGIGPNGGFTTDGLTWTTNSPGAGSIAWSNFVLTYQGIQYTIPSGSSGTDFWVYWQKSVPGILQHAAQGSPTLPPLGADDFVLFLNNNSGNSVAICINITRTDGAHRLILNSDSMFLVNSSNKVVANLGIGGAEQGSFTLWNSTQTAANTIKLDPNVSKVSVGGTSLTDVEIMGIGPNGTLIVDGRLTWTANSPGAGSVAWSACSVSYQGTTYAVSAGNTSNFWIYWQLSSPTVFQTAAQGTPSIPALGADDFIIALNNNGGNTVATCINLLRTDASHRIIVNADSFFLVNTSNKVVANLGVGGSEQGKLTLWNSTQAGANTIVLDPATPAITVGGTAITVP